MIDTGAGVKGDHDFWSFNRGTMTNLLEINFANYQAFADKNL